MTRYFVHESAYIDPDVQIGDGTKIWHFSHIQRGARIGAHCVLGQNVNVGNHVRIGDYCKIQNNVSIYEGVILEKYVFCGPSMVFTNVMNPRCKYPQSGSEYYVKTFVGEGASLGANCTIVCGNRIGKHAFVGAGTVVVNDVPDYALVVGNPAHLVGWMSEVGNRLFFESNNEARCSVSGKRYKLLDGLVTPICSTKIDESSTDSVS